MKLYQYPYGNSQQLNLDWLLNQWRIFQQQVENMIAPQWSDTGEYAEGDAVINNHVLYVCSVAHATVHQFIADEWQTTTLAELMGV